MSAELLLTDAPQITANEMLMAKEAAETLHTHYPGYLWAVSIQDALLDVRCLNVSGTWGFSLHIPAFYSASEWKKSVMRAGGEILERYRQRRGRLDEQKIRDVPRDFAGRLQFER